MLGGKNKITGLKAKSMLDNTNKSPEQKITSLKVNRSEVKPNQVPKGGMIGLRAKSTKTK